MADSAVFQSSLPRAFHDSDGAVVECDDESSGFAARDEEFLETFGERDLSRFALGRFRARNVEVPVENWWRIPSR